MPNWCSNILEIRVNENTKEAKKQFEELLKVLEVNKKLETIGENPFNRLVPMPESLRITSGGGVDFGMAVINSIENNDHSGIDKIMNYGWVKDDADIQTREDLIIHLTTGEHPRADVKQGKIAIENLKLYEHKDWFSWSKANWGTKWDLETECQIVSLSEDKIVLAFSTAWTPPTKVFEKVGKKYNLLYFELEYEEPSCAFEGTFIVENGESSDDTRVYDKTKECKACFYDEEDCETNGVISCPSGVSEEDWEEECPCKICKLKKKK